MKSYISRKLPLATRTTERIFALRSLAASIAFLPVVGHSRTAPAGRVMAPICPIFRFVTARWPCRREGAGTVRGVQVLRGARDRMKTTFTLAVLLWLAPACAAPRPKPVSQQSPRPRLVVVLVVDQMRADYLTRFAPRFLPSTDASPGGFRFFIEHAAYWPFAHYDLLQAMTGPGHATVLSGSYPYRNGISLNSWCSVDEKGRTRPIYCVQDEKAPLVGGNPPLTP